MKKKLLSIAVVAAVAVAAAWGFNQQERNIVLSNLALENVEVLAYGEKTGSSYGCIYGAVYGGIMPARLCESCSW